MVSLLIVMASQYVLFSDNNNSSYSLDILLVCALYSKSASEGYIRAIYTRQNKTRLTEDAS